MNREKVFSKIGYTYLDEMIESLSKYPGIKIQYPISDFTAGNTLFKTVTYDVNIAVATYSKYREEIELLNKEVDRLTKSIDSLNNKFCNELTFIKPSWGYFKNISYEDAGYFDGDVFESSLKKAESYYFKLIEKGWKPQQARQVLPNATKTELIMTGFESDWEHFFELRCSGAAHPDAKKLADELRELMVK